MKPEHDPHFGIRRYYNEVYHNNAVAGAAISGHLRRLARRIGVQPGERVLDVGCGVGEFLRAVCKSGAVPVGIDLSDRAIGICRTAMPEGEFVAGPAERLPYADHSFDVVSCLGSLEHFLDPSQALREMVRVARPGARVLVLVPNSGFLTRRLGLYRGTEQRLAREEVRTLTEWNALFRENGLEVFGRWRDLHVLSWDWINRGGITQAPVRAAQALALAVWPLGWQYQVFHLCKVVHPKDRT